MSSQSIQSPIMISSYQQQHSSGGNPIPHSPKPPGGSGQHYNQIQSPMQVSVRRKRFYFCCIPDWLVKSSGATTAAAALFESDSVADAAAAIQSAFADDAVVSATATCRTEPVQYTVAHVVGWPPAVPAAHSFAHAALVFLLHQLAHDAAASTYSRPLFHMLFI